MMKRPMMIYDENDSNLYVVAYRSEDWRGRAIQYLSNFRSGLEEFDHVALVYRGNEYHMTFPRAEKRLARYRDENVVYQVVSGIPRNFWGYVGHVISSRQGYGLLQLLTKAFTMLFGWQPFKRGMDCIEFVVRALAEPDPKDVDRWTVGQGLKYLQDKGQIKEIARYNKGQEYKLD